MAIQVARNSRAIATALSALLLGAVATAPASAAHDDDIWQAWYEIGGFYNSDDASRGEATVFVPLTQSLRDLTFVDVRGKIFEEDVEEGNFALGYRHMTSSGFNLGAWIGGDVRNTSLDNTFWQLSGGLEALSHNFDARVNWYGPVTDPQLANDATGTFTEVLLSGNNIFMIGGEEVALKGFDGELGVRLPVEFLQIDPNQIELRAYGGGFYFDHDDALEEVAGGKARIELAINDIIPELPGSQLTAEYEYSYDDVREDRHEVGARLRIPFSQPGHGQALRSLTGQQRRMVARIERDTDIITVQSEEENVEDALTNTDFDRVAFVNNGGSITDKSAKAGDNSLLIVRGTVNNGTQTVQANQTVQGGGSTIQVRGRKSGAVVGFTAPGSKPTVINTGGGNVISITGDNTHIAGLLIDGNNNGGNGIGAGNDKTNIAITQNMIQNTGNNGIRFVNRNSKILIQNNTITDPATNEGIDFGNDNSDVIIDGNTITDPSSDGILFNNRNNRITVTNNIISGGNDQGIEFDDDNSNVTIEGNRIFDFNDEGIDFDDNNTNIRIANNMIFDVNDEGIQFSNGNANVTILNNNIVAGDDAILFDGANNDANRNRNIIISGNTLVAGGNDEGIQFDDGNQNITITNNIITAGDDGIFMDNNNTGLTISGNTITSNTEDGIELDNNNAGTISGNTIIATNGDGINLNNGNVFTISGNTFGVIGDDAIRIRANNTVEISDNLFNGAIGGQLLDVDNAGNTLSGAGNDSNVPITCQANGAGAFAGTVSFLDGTVLQDNVAPCN